MIKRARGTYKWTKVSQLGSVLCALCVITSHVGGAGGGDSGTSSGGGGGGGGGGLLGYGFLLQI
jgi:hypothetical protein